MPDNLTGPEGAASLTPAAAGRVPNHVARDQVIARDVIGEFMAAYSDQPYHAADRLIAALWDAGITHFARWVEGAHEGPAPFVLERTEDVTGVSGTGVVAEGVEFTGGVVALRWLSDWPTSVVFHSRGIESVEAVHGHGGKTRVVWT